MQVQLIKVGLTIRPGEITAVGELKQKTRSAKNENRVKITKHTKITTQDLIQMTKLDILTGDPRSSPEHLV